MLVFYFLYEWLFETLTTSNVSGFIKLIQAAVSWCLPSILFYDIFQSVHSQLHFWMCEIYIQLQDVNLYNCKKLTKFYQIDSGSF